MYIPWVEDTSQMGVWVEGAVGGNDPQHRYTQLSLLHLLRSTSRTLQEILQYGTKQLTPTQGMILAGKGQGVERLGLLHSPGLMLYRE